MSDLLFDLSPTVSAFVHTDANIVILRGPKGEGKTYGGVAALIRHAERCQKDIYGALIRDTHQNIKMSTARDIQDVLGSYGTFKDDCKQLIIHSKPKVHMYLFGIDDPAALSKLQAFQCSIIWLEEPAPIKEAANAGLPRDVYNHSIVQAARQQGTILRVQITQNPADEDHWTEEVANEPEVVIEDPETGLKIIKKVFNIPYGENKYLKPMSRLATRAAFKEGTGEHTRYVKGKAAPLQKGKKVLPEYGDMHYANRELPVIPGAVGVRFYDAWHHPTCIIGQLVPPGKLWVHQAFSGEGMGMRELITEQVKPALSSPKYKDKIHDWRDIGDPSMKTPDQSTITMSAAKVVEDLLNTRFEPGPTRWKARIQPTKTALSRLATDGEIKILVSSTAYKLHRSLNGGWHWKTDNSGNIIGTLPVQNDNFAHLGNAFAYGVSIVFPYEYEDQKKGKKKNQNNKFGRAMSYAPSSTSVYSNVPPPMI